MATSPEVKRKDLLTVMMTTGKLVSKVEIKEVTMGANQKAPLHLHPCPVVGVITQGIISYQIEGETVHYLNVGDAFYEPAHVRVARFDNDGDGPAKFIAVYLLNEDDNEIIRVLHVNHHTTAVRKLNL